MMAGGDPKASSSKPPPPTSSSSYHRTSRWDSSPSANNNNHPSSSTPNPKSPASASNHSTLPSYSPSPSPIPNSSNNLTPKHGGIDSAKANPNPSTSQHAMDPLPPPPKPSYDFDMLERRTIALADGSVRTFLALPLDYREFVPPPRAIHHLSRFPPMIDMFRRGDEQFPWSLYQPHWNPPGIDGIRDGPPEVSMKRKRGEEEMDVYKHELPWKTHHSSKFMRVDDAFDAMADDFDASHHYQRVDQDALKKAFYKFVKLLNENVLLKKNCLQNGKLGRLPCIACERSSKDFPDVHGLVVHAYNLDNADLRVDHLGLHKALCILMGWKFMRPPDNSMAYQSLPSDVAATNQEDLILWPPAVLIHNTSTGKVKDGRVDGYGNKAMDRIMKVLGFRKGKSKSLYNREGHLGIVLVKFAADRSGLREAIRLANHFEKENRGRKAWSEVQSMFSDDENHPKLVEVDKRTGERKKVFYGHLFTAFDLDKVDHESRKKAVVESKRELLQSQVRSRVLP